MDQDKLSRVLSLVILFLLATTLFNTLRANRVEKRTTSFRKQARYELKINQQQLAEQKVEEARIKMEKNTTQELAEHKDITARLEETLDQLLAEQAED